MPLSPLEVLPVNGFLELVLLVAYAMAITALLITGVAHVAVATDGNRRDAVPVDQAAPPRPAVVPEQAGLDLPEVWGHGSFPASDPPANW